ncbi:MAG: DUF4239 domain-containing protein [Magnetospirillum sp. WYHS-4]
MDFITDLVGEISGAGGWFLWLIHLPTWTVAAVILAGGILFSLLCVLAVNNYVTQASLIQNNLVASFKLGFIAEIFAGLMAFFMVEAGTRYGNADTYVQVEAAAWRNLSQIVAEFPPEQAAAFRANLSRYADSVVRTEWPTMETGDESPISVAAFETLLNSWFAIEPSDPRQQSVLALGNLVVSQAVEARTSRFSNNVSNRIATLTWFTLLALVLISVAFNAFFGMHSLRGQLWMGAVLGLGIFVNVFLAFVLGNPFAGDLAVDPSPFLELAR